MKLTKKSGALDQQLLSQYSLLTASSLLDIAGCKEVSSLCSEKKMRLVSPSIPEKHWRCVAST